MTLPTDPDYDDGPAPEIGGTLEYNARGLPSRVNMTLDAASRAIVDELVYTRDGLVEEVHYGDDLEGDGMTSRTPTVSFTTYDDRRRPVRMRTERSPNAHGEGMSGTELDDAQIRWLAARAMDLARSGQHTMSFGYDSVGPPTAFRGGGIGPEFRLRSHTSTVPPRSGHGCGCSAAGIGR